MGRRVDAFCGGTSSVRGEVVKVENGVLHLKDEDDEVGRYTGTGKLAHYIDFGRAEEKATAGGTGLVTSKVGLDGVAGAFVALADPEAQVKILVEPGR